MSMESLGALMQNPMAPKKKRRRRSPEKGMMEAMRRRVIERPKGQHAANIARKAKPGQTVFKDMPGTRVGQKFDRSNWEDILAAAQDRSNRGFPGPNGVRREPKPPTVLPANARSNAQEALKRRLKKGKVKSVGHRGALSGIREFFNR